MDAYLAYLAAAKARLEPRQEAMMAEFGLMDFQRWEVELEAGRITFRNAQGRARVTGTAWWIGSFAHADATWMWGWANDTLPLAQRQHSVPMRAFGEQMRQRVFIDGVLQFGVPANADADYVPTMAKHIGWELMSVVLDHLGGLGAWRGPDAEARLDAFYLIRDLARSA